MTAPPTIMTTDCNPEFQSGTLWSSCVDHHAVAATRPRAPRGRVEAITSFPQVEHADPDDGADRRGQGDRVVLVDDPLAEAEHSAGDDEPAAPQEQRGAGAVGARARAASHEQPGAEQDQRGGDQPRRLAAELGVEQAGPAGRAPAGRRCPPAPPPTLPVSSPVSRPKPL